MFYTTSAVFRSCELNIFLGFLQVRVSFYSKGKETAYAVFDAHGVSDKNGWFDCSRLLYTAYNDLNRLKAVSYCGIPGYVMPKIFSVLFENLNSEGLRIRLLPCLKKSERGGNDKKTTS